MNAMSSPPRGTGDLDRPDDALAQQLQQAYDRVRSPLPPAERWIDGALAEVARRQRAVLVLRYLEDFSTEQIAQALSMSPGAVRSTTHRAYETLRGLAEQERSPDDRLAAGG